MLVHHHTLSLRVGDVGNRHHVPQAPGVHVADFFDSSGSDLEGVQLLVGPILLDAGILGVIALEVAHPLLRHFLTDHTGGPQRPLDGAEVCDCNNEGDGNASKATCEDALGNT